MSDWKYSTETIGENLYHYYENEESGMVITECPKGKLNQVTELDRHGNEEDTTDLYDYEAYNSGAIGKDDLGEYTEGIK